jgi:hypothetical protein
MKTDTTLSVWHYSHPAGALIAFNVCGEVALLVARMPGATAAKPRRWM